MKRVGASPRFHTAGLGFIQGKTSTMSRTAELPSELMCWFPRQIAVTCFATEQLEQVTLSPKELAQIAERMLPKPVDPVVKDQLGLKTNGLDGTRKLSRLRWNRSVLRRTRAQDGWVAADCTAVCRG
jgi:hypothetical protein